MCHKIGLILHLYMRHKTDCIISDIKMTQRLVLVTIMQHALTKMVISAVNVTLDLTVMDSHVPMSTSVITHHVMLTLPVQMNSVHFHVHVTLDSVE